MTLFLYAVLLFGIFVTVYLGRILTQNEPVLLIVLILGLIGIICSILYHESYQLTNEAYQTFKDAHGWGNYGLAALVGSSAICNSFCGFDGADHIGRRPPMVPI